MPFGGLGWHDGAALGALLLAVLHLGFARRVDLGPAVVAATGMALLAPDAGSSGGVYALAGVAVVVALAWWRGGRAGTGRPDLTGMVVAAIGLAHAADHALRGAAALPPVAPGALLGPILLVGLVATLLSASAPSLPGRRVHHHREVPVHAQPGAAR